VDRSHAAIEIALTVDSHADRLIYYTSHYSAEMFKSDFLRTKRLLRSPFAQEVTIELVALLRI